MFSLILDSQNIAILQTRIMNMCNRSLCCNFELPIFSHPILENDVYLCMCTKICNFQHGHAVKESFRSIIANHIAEEISFPSKLEIQFSDLDETFASKK